MDRVVAKITTMLYCVWWCGTMVIYAAMCYKCHNYWHIDWFLVNKGFSPNAFNVASLVFCRILHIPRKPSIQCSWFIHHIWSVCWLLCNFFAYFKEYWYVCLLFSLVSLTPVFPVFLSTVALQPIECKIIFLCIDSATEKQNLSACFVSRPENVGGKTNI